MPHKACFKSCAIATPKINFFHLELGFWDEIPIDGANYSSCLKISIAL